MKSFSIVHILLFILFMLVYQCTQAQDYVVTIKGDTLYGEVKPLSFGPDKKVQIAAADKKKIIYSLFQVRSYSYKSEIYHPVKNDRGYTFMKLIKPGYLSLYAFQLENQLNYDSYFLLKKDGARLEVPNLTFKKVMTKFLEDCTVVKEKLQSGEYGKKEIEKIIDEYNGCIDTHTVDHNKVVSQNQDQVKKTNAWESLEEKVKAKPDFQGKTDALEMISDIKGKIKRDEKVQNFLIEGLKNSLAGTDLSSDLESALGELKK